MIYEESMEALPRDEMAQLQIERLQVTLNRVYRSVAFYRHTFDRLGVDIERLKSIEALRTLPFTTREDLRRAYPYDMFAVPLRDVLRIHCTSGTTGQPIIVGYTRNDLRHWTTCAARLLCAAGITEHDVVQIAFPYNLFTGGFGFHQGAELLGASVIPASSTTSIEKQIVIMRDFKTTVLVSTSSYAGAVASAFRERGIHPESLQLRVGLFGAEPWTERVRTALEEALHVTAIDSYGLTEIMGPGVAGECLCKDGMHVNEDHFIVEVVDPATGEPVAPGEKGELVFTTITKEAFPVIRYRTGDISALIEEPCACGRTTRRLRRVMGRTDDRFIFEGIGVFPAQIAQILLDVEGISPHYQIVLDRDGGKDTFELKVEVSGAMPSIDELKTLERLRTAIAARIEADLAIQARVTFVEPKSLRREGAGRIAHVVDLRA